MSKIILSDGATWEQPLTETNGYGTIEALTHYVTEERNGVYDLEFTFSADEKHMSRVIPDKILKAKVSKDNWQLFRVYQVTKPMNGIITAYCHHITYDLGAVVVKPFTATGITATLAGLKSNAISMPSPYNIESDIDNQTSAFSNDIPHHFRELMGGVEGSLLDTFGGEYEYDNYTVKLLAERGQDNGVKITYGKNLTDVQQEQNCESVYHGAVGYAVYNEQTYMGSTVWASTTNQRRRVKIIDFSSEFTETEPTTAAITALTQTYINNNDIVTPSVNLTVSFVNLADTDQYKDLALLEGVNLCDTVTVEFPKLGVSAKAKVIKTVWNGNTERYDEIELGEPRTSLAQSIAEEAISQSAQATGFLNQYVTALTNVVTNSLGLFSTKVQKSNGGYQYYLHNRPTLAESQYQWTINAGAFAVSQDYGQTWSAGITAEGDAVFNSLAANVVRAMEIYGSYIEGSRIRFGDSSTYVDAYPYNGGVAFSGTGNIDMNTKGRFWLRNGYSNGGEANSYIGYITNDETSTMGFTNRYKASSGSGTKSNEMLLNGADASFKLTNYPTSGDESIYSLIELAGKMFLVQNVNSGTITNQIALGPLTNLNIKVADNYTIQITDSIGFKIEAGAWGSIFTRESGGEKQIVLEAASIWKKNGSTYTKIA